MTRPEHLDPDWRFIPLTTKDGKARPMHAMNAQPSYWEGASPDWEGFQGWVTGGNPIGMLVERSGLVVLDCDVKEYDSQGWVIQGNTASFSPATYRHGITDLTRVAGEHGKTVVPTFTVRTKSGGYHLYYRQNPQLPVTSKPHRDGWLIDVKASRNSWVVAPPSPGYEVVRDLPAAVMPLWLARWVSELTRLTMPIGGARVRNVMLDAARLRVNLIGSKDEDLFTRWVSTVLTVVALANRHGGWNNEIYRASHELFDVGLSLDEVEPAVLRAAAPVDERERRGAVDTIRSAWRKHLEGVSYESYVSEVL